MKPSPAHEKAWMKVKNQQEGIKYGCHVDLGPDEEPDGCVIDDSIRSDCIYANRHRTREGCRWWRKVETHQNRG